MSAMLDSLLDAERLADCISNDIDPRFAAAHYLDGRDMEIIQCDSHAPPVGASPVSDNNCPTSGNRETNEGRGCECSDLATKEAMGPGWWLVIVPSVFVILVQVTPLVRGYLPF